MSNYLIISGLKQSKNVSQGQYIGSKGQQLKEKRRYCCRVCNKIYSHTSSLSRHVHLQHHGIRHLNTVATISPFQESWASKNSFSQQAEFRKNQKISQAELKDQKSSSLRQCLQQIFSDLQQQKLPLQGKQISQKSIPPTHNNGEYILEKIDQRSDLFDNKPHNCKLCSRSFWKFSSLLRHLRKIHGTQKLHDGKILIENTNEQPFEQPTEKEFQCQLCPAVYKSRKTLSNHFNSRHNPNIAQIDSKDLYLCGCGRAYKTKVLLCIHQKKEHWGMQPKLIQRNEYNADLVRLEGTVQSKKQLSFVEQRPYMCGCGRRYLIYSNLASHIKRIHNSVIPKGTIGRPKNKLASKLITQDDQNNYSLKTGHAKNLANTQSFKKCKQCRMDISFRSHYQCGSCQRHYLCSECFWKKDNFCPEHQWSVTEITDKDN